MSNGRFRQANREALITLAVYIFFFLWWTVFAFGLGSGDPDNYSYVLGLPSWFFYSCVLGYPVVTILLWLVIKRWFKDIPLDGEPESAGPDNLNAASAGSENTAEKS
ncbi:YhdT family protein [Desulfovibrio sp. OttesenSCG-928-C06]|nr:YhdT family protein [Desulfovibrio sp. OttesenSCG-928-C06]